MQRDFKSKRLLPKGSIGLFRLYISGLDVPFGDTIVQFLSSSHGGTSLLALNKGHFYTFRPYSNDKAETGFHAVSLTFKTLRIRFL
jgi:hypothetical protein